LSERAAEGASDKHWLKARLINGLTYLLTDLLSYNSVRALIWNSLAVSVDWGDLRHIMPVLLMFFYFGVAVYITVCITVCLAAIWRNNKLIN